MSSTPCRVVYIEDNPTDVRLMEEALRESLSPHNLSVIADGEKALTFFRQFGEDSSMIPDLVFLDLRLPKVDGLEVLRYIKTTEHLSSIPVVAFAQAADPYCAAAYEYGADLCVDKPTVELESHLALIQDIVGRFCSGGPDGHDNTDTSQALELIHKEAHHRRGRPTRQF